MKRVELFRSMSTVQGTVGKMLSFATMEPPWRDNARRVSCIPPGIYQCHITKSPRYGHVYTVVGVPDRDHILIHAGNFGGDESLGFKTNTEGCILLGKRDGSLLGQRAVLASRGAVSEFNQTMNGEPFELVISWDG